MGAAPDARNEPGERAGPGSDTPRLDASRPRAPERAASTDDWLDVPRAAWARPPEPTVAHRAVEPAPQADDLTAVLRSALADRYVVEAEVDRGGMAVVYRARDLRHGRTVAIKAVLPDYSSPGTRARFLREIRIAAALQHPHVVAVYDSGAIGDVRYYVMPFVEGESLRQRLARPPALTVEEVTRIVRDVASALAYAHGRGVVHRDIKPANVLLSGADALVADFGIARALAPDSDPEHPLTAPSSAVGTPGYMAPEQAWAMPLDHRADLYALGVVAYEMLVGARPPAPHRAPAGAATRRDMIAREIVARKPDAPPALGDLVATLLAELPDERPPGAEVVIARLDALPSTREWRDGAGARRRRLVARPAAVIAAGLLVAAAGLGAWRVRVGRPGAVVSLDPHRIMIFPPEIAAADWRPGTGEDVATMIGSALDGTPPLRWLEARDYARATSGDDAGAARRALSRAKGAAYFIDGRIMRQGDSARVVLRLHAVDGDSTVARRQAAAPLHSADVTQLALRAVGELLVPLLAPGRRVDVAALAGHPPAAIAAFLEGERAYRSARFAHALERYEAALAQDSTLAVAALNGAQAATWIERADEADRLARLALVGAGALPAHRAALARGMVRFLDGDADSALAAFGEVLARDSSRAEPWMALGEVYRHLLPDRANLDSLAEDAFTRARAADTAFTPALYHLAEAAIRRGALARADTLVAAWRGAMPDSAAYLTLERMLRCARGGPDAVRWADVAATAPLLAIEAGRVLAGSAAPSACAEAALWAAATAPNASSYDRWGAQYVLLGVLLAARRDADVPAFARRVAREDADLAGQFLMLAGAAGAGPAGAADSVARTLGTRYRFLSTPRLWLLGTWSHANGESAALQAVAATLARRADSSHARVDRLVASAIGARATLARGDTAAAIRALSALRPAASRTALTWYAWEALAAERLLLARLLLARRDPAGAARVASEVDGLQSVVSLVFLAPALQVRAEAADAAGDAATARRVRQRLAWLSRSGAPMPAAPRVSVTSRP